MKGLLGLALSVAVVTAVPARAEEARPLCDLPAYMVTTESQLSKVSEVIKNGKPLNILVVGSRSSTIETADQFAYPARLKAMLAEKLPSIATNVVADIQPKKTAEETGGGLAKLVDDKKPELVVWQTGTVDAMRSIDPDDFRNGLDEGLNAIRSAGANVILMNLQYSPRTETMISVAPYLDSMRAIAQQQDVPLFDRFAMMRYWSEAGDFDLFSTAHGLELAKRVHDCVAQALAKLIVDTARPNQVQQN